MAYKCFNLAARNNYNGPTSNFNDTKIGRYLLVIHFTNKYFGSIWYKCINPYLC